MLLKQGEVYWVSLNPIEGSEIKGTSKEGQRPCVIVSPNVLNKYLNTVIIAPCTTNLKNTPFRAKVNSLEKTSEVALDQIRAVDKLRLGEKMGALNRQELQKCLEILRNIFSSSENK